METLKLSKEQFDTIITNLRAIENAERNSDSTFIRRFFEELINTKIVTFGLLAASNKLTQNTVDELHQTYLWLNRGKDVFKNSADNSSLDAITKRVYAVLTTCYPERYTKQSSVTSAATKFYSEAPRNSTEPLVEGQELSYGSSQYIVVGDSHTENNLRLATYRNGSYDYGNVTPVRDGGTIRSVRRGCYLRILPDTTAPVAANVANDMIIEEMLTENGVVRYRLEDSIQEMPTTRTVVVSNNPPTAHLGSGIPAHINYESDTVITFNYFNSTYRLLVPTNLQGRLMFKAIKVTGNGDYRYVIVSANFIRRNNIDEFQLFLNWYKAMINYNDHPAIDPSIELIEARHGNPRLRRVAQEGLF